VAGIESALTRHFINGHIRGWKPRAAPPGETAGWEVALSNGDTAELATIMEATWFSHGIDTAHQAGRGMALSRRGDACGECGRIDRHEHEGR
jgi:hypothetical protein